MHPREVLSGDMLLPSSESRLPWLGSRRLVTSSHGPFVNDLHPGSRADCPPFIRDSGKVPEPHGAGGSSPGLPDSKAHVSAPSLHLGNAAAWQSHGVVGRGCHRDSCIPAGSLFASASPNLGPLRFRILPYQSIFDSCPLWFLEYGVKL